MLIDIITNFAIMFTFTILIYWFFSSIKKTQPKNKINNPLLSTLIGISFGALGLGIIGLFFGGHHHVLINTRFVPFLLGGMLGGPITMLVTGLFIFICRLIIGFSSHLSLIFAINSLIGSIALSIFTIYKPLTFKTIPYYFTVVLSEITLLLLFFHPFKKEDLISIVVFVCYSIVLYTFLSFFLKRQQEMNNNALKSIYLTKVDFLTQLPNSHALESKLQYLIKENISFEIIHLDIDLFKNFNMEYGYQNGDQLLSQLAHTIRKYAEENNAFAARIGGDEFCYIQKNSSPAESIMAGHHLSQLIQNTPYTIGQETIHITVSASIVSYPENGKTMSEIYSASHSTLRIITESKTNVLMHYNQLKQAQKYY